MCGATSEINASTVDAARVALRHLSYLDMLFSRHSPAHITATAFGGAHVIKCVVLQTFAAGRAEPAADLPLAQPRLAQPFDLFRRNLDAGCFSRACCWARPHCTCFDGSR